MVWYLRDQRSDCTQVILHLAVQGKLVEQGPGEISIDSVPEFVPASLPFGVPDNWRWTEFGAIAEISGGFAFNSADYAENGVFILRVTNITSRGTINRTDAVFLAAEKVSVFSFFIATYSADAVGSPRQSLKTAFLSYAYNSNLDTSDLKITCDLCRTTH